MEEQALMAKLKQTEEQKNYGSSVQFRVTSHQHMGMLIGTNGNNIKKAQSLPGVQIIDVRQAKTLDPKLLT
jgi:transcription antitermination factor NusA-like protein